MKPLLHFALGAAALYLVVRAVAVHRAINGVPIGGAKPAADTVTSKGALGSPVEAPALSFGAAALAASEMNGSQSTSPFMKGCH